MKKTIGNSFRMQMLLSVFGAFIILVLSTTYILYSTIKLQELSDNSFQRERFIKSIQEALIAYQEPLLEYLSTRSSNALARHLIESQQLRSSLPASMAVSRDPTELREKEVYSLIEAFLDLADAAVDEKRGRNISGYTTLYDEMTTLLRYINAQIEIIGTDRFRNQLDRYGAFIGISRNIQSWNLVFIVAISLFAILLLLRSVEKTTLPMTRLSSMATGISEGNFGMEDIKMSSIYEIDHVVEAFNRMKSEIGSQIEEIRRQENIKQEYMQEKMRNLKMEALVRRMEIYTLQAQMNPHFLFNTLNTGMQLAIVEGADRTGEYMEYLSLLFRHNVRNADIIVPLRHEIEGLKYYFYILKVRFPRNLDLSLDYADALLDDIRVPVSILQPLVENCVVHAFKNREERSSILVRAEKKGSLLVLTVADNGSGMDKGTIESLLHPLPIDASSSRVMGLENIIQRLYFFYPDDPGVIRIESSLGRGSSIVISIDTEREPCMEF
jgi:nitrogen fixation/metabolism regulation signal transduction histidine kinase